MAGIPFINHQVNHPVSGDMRQNRQTGQMEVYNGRGWVPVKPDYIEQETLADSILHAQDTIESYIEEDYRDNAAIQDAYAEWAEACSRFRVIAGLAEK